MIKKVFTVSDMHCPNCALRVEGIEDDLPGVVRVEASYKKGQMTVECDEALVSDAQIIAAVKAKGYTALPGGGI